MDSTWTTPNPDLTSLLDNFPSELSSGTCDSDASATSQLGDLFSPLGASFEPSTLVELLEIENQMLDDQSWLWDDGLLDLAFDAPPAQQQQQPFARPMASSQPPRMVPFMETLYPTKTYNLANALCPDFTYSPALSRPAIMGSQVAFGTQFLLKGQQNKVVLCDFDSIDLFQLVDAREAAHSFTWLEQGCRLAFACGSALATLRVGQPDTSRPLYTQDLHESGIRDMGVNWRGNFVISGGNDGNVFVSDLELLLSNATEKHTWCARLNSSVSSVSFHPMHPEVVSVTTDYGVVFTKDIREGKDYIERLSPRVPPSSEALLFDHLWLSDTEVLLGYSDGTLIRASMHNGPTGGILSSLCDPRLVELDALETLGAGRVGAFGNGGATCYALSHDVQPMSTFTPPQQSFLGHGGCFAPRYAGMLVTAADGSVFCFKNCFQ